MKKLVRIVILAVLFTVLPLQGPAEGNRQLSAANGSTPRLCVDTASVEKYQPFRLSWNVEGAEKVVLKQKPPRGTFSTVLGGEKLPAKGAFNLRKDEPGTYEYYIFAWINGKSVRSNTVTVNVSSGDTETPEQGMENIWRIQAVICHSIRISRYSNSFSQNEVNHIKNLLSALPGTLFNLSDGKMCAVITGVHEIKNPITSVSGGMGDLIPEKDFALKDFLRDDTTLLMVFAPLEGCPKVDWGGLGGYTHTWRGHTFYMVEISSALAWEDSGKWVRNGIRYERCSCTMVHEILHAVELNSEKNGWSGFQGLHDAGKNGYNDHVDWMDWYSDMMTDSLKSGKSGFHDISFYVQPGSARNRAGK